MRGAPMMYFFSPYHLLPVFAELGFVFVLYVCFRGRSAWAKRAVIIVLMALNIAQHFLKHYIYPHILTQTFALDNTLYNVCAYLILLSPFMHFGKSPSARQFIACVGSVAGSIAVIVPFWFFGKDLSEPAILSEYLRFWVCHALLCASSVLPILWHGVTFNYLDVWKLPFHFLGMLCVLLLNDTVVLIGSGSAAAETLYARLAALNPIGIMGPPNNNFPFPALISAVVALTPSVFLGGNGKPFTPILWYAFPLSVALIVVGILVEMVLDRRNFFADMRLLFLRKGTPPVRKRLTRRDYGVDLERDIRF